MSGQLVTLVYESALPGWLKYYAAIYASYAKDDGSSIFPSIRTVARMAGKSERATQTATALLRQLGILEVVTPYTRTAPYHYLLNVAVLQKTGPLRALRGTRRRQLELFPQGDEQKDSANRRFPQDAQAFTGSPLHPGVKWASPDPSIDPSISTCTRARENKQAG